MRASTGPVLFLSTILFVGCQEYGFVEPPDDLQLPPATPPTLIVDTDEPDDPPVPVAEEPVYANTTDTLYTVEPLTGDRTEIAQFRTAGGTVVQQMLDIAIDHEGRVYGGTFDALYRIDPVTAQVEKVCDTDIEFMGMAFTPNGDLLAAGDTIIKRVDLDSCNSTPVVFNTPYETSGDLVGLPDGYLYWTVWEEDNADGLVRIDPNTWQITYLGTIPVGRLFGLGYAEDQLFGFSSNGQTASIMPGQNVNGYVDTLVLHNEPTVSWWGATTNPVAW
jgi:hypothetical protein